MQQLKNFDYIALEFDRDGKAVDPAQALALEAHVKSAGVTDVLFLAHGFRNDANDATRLYTDFLENFGTSVGLAGVKPALAGRRFAVAGVFWPSKSFSEGTSSSDEGAVRSAGDDEEREAARAQLQSLLDEFSDPVRRKAIEEALALFDSVTPGDPDAQDAFVEKVLSVIAEGQDDSEGLGRILATPGHELLRKLAFPVIVPTSAEEEGDGGAAGVLGSVSGGGDDGEAQGIGSLFSKIGGQIGKFLNLTTWYVMKDRCGLVGANGLQAVVRSLRKAAPGVKVHLTGHSLGARLVTSCARALAQAPPVEVSSLSLLQGAFSHYGFAANNGFGSPGFFRSVIDGKVVKGPIIATHSRKDSVVGYAYAISSRAAGDNVRAIGDANDQYGGIGRNGALGTAESVQLGLAASGAPYALQLGEVNNLNGDNTITSHGDVTRSEVTWAVASAIALT